MHAIWSANSVLGCSTIPKRFCRHVQFFRVFIGFLRVRGSVEYGAKFLNRLSLSSTNASLLKNSSTLWFSRISELHRSTFSTSFSSLRLANMWRLIPNCCDKSRERKDFCRLLLRLDGCFLFDGSSFSSKDLFHLTKNTLFDQFI